MTLKFIVELFKLYTGALQTWGQVEGGPRTLGPLVKLESHSTRIWINFLPTSSSSIFICLIATALPVLSSFPL